RHVLDDQAALRLRLLLLLRLERAHAQSERVGLVGRPVALATAGFGLLWHLLLQLRDLHRDRALLAVAPHLQGSIHSRLHGRDRSGQLPVALDRASVDAENHIAGDDAGLGGWTVALDHAHQSPARAVEPEGLRQLRVDVLDGDADAAAHHVAGLDQLLLDIARHVDRNRERHAHVAARAAEDLRVDAD